MIDPTGEVGQGAGPPVRDGREETKCEGGCGSVSSELGGSCGSNEVDTTGTVGTVGTRGSSRVFDAL